MAVGSVLRGGEAPGVRAGIQDKILVAATDLNVSLTAELEAENTSEGGITLGAKTSTSSSPTHPAKTWMRVQ